MQISDRIEKAQGQSPEMGRTLLVAYLKELGVEYGPLGSPGGCYRAPFYNCPWAPQRTSGVGVRGRSGPAHEGPAQYIKKNLGCNSFPGFTWWPKPTAGGKPFEQEFF